MYKTLKDLRNYVDSLIKEEGENAFVSYWIRTKKDVMKVEIYDEDGNETFPYDEKFANKVVQKLSKNSSISEHIQDCIMMEIGYQSEEEETDQWN